MKIFKQIKLNYKRIGYVLVSILLIGGVFGIGLYFGYTHRPEIDKVTTVINKTPTFETTADFTAFWKAWNVLKDKSIYSDKITDQDRVWGAVQGLAGATGDPYTTFFSPEDNKLFREEIKGSFSGIGAEVGVKDKVLTIIAPLKNTPAWNAGIKAGDKIIKIEKTNTSELSVDKAITLMRGEKGTPVTLTIFRTGEKEAREIKIIRDTIDIPTIETEALPDGIFLIKFYSFSENSDNLFAKALDEFIKSGDHKLILDLRGNPGGYLDVAVNIGSWFIDEGKVIVNEDFGANRKAQSYRSHGPRIFNDKLQFVVLIDGGSASASEILAGALKEHKIATLVGEKTFGKGSVQELVEITGDTSLKVTVAKWLTPNGVSISTSGLDPDIKVSVTSKDYEAKRDPQMNKAVEILKAKQ
ncbi:MAG: Carboxyl-terminal protease [Candidatus Nomurabacteria bacterium GW2011_GWF2_35_66]|uniref:Carboxyl-terminal protease n=1 Tax=Candidatus Nomurabacteria bacterium GW2011_GWE1_35_16 TaxID=1618761 RepID=A0A0G0BA77_9BACT|nr:MAG: Carboxyl-terminal protease [Candidatus Nomurabacteria bacterium GW2011_GWF1_34_20]KKP62840.1 MAG: Carboxyl-terminal protease [Candidatus Nomurabacteria bacterium GW2011_GWE2_34_25]KKP66239.1 MAG: Carboxyl-terminal protease [Candidatus Nomurabacteria bacterium GW2011_GWE1_35_16]KKP83071.1 MAG: Carboxyl-terminal protease [Candidatus Nomurabacteria bacterium GW2011_GWF2_35_66]HAE36666.1 peptidase S41 [Candidatus Nomurabacteria bacterium]